MQAEKPRETQSLIGETYLMSDLSRRSVSAVAWNFAGGGSRALAQIFIQIVLARILGPEIFGQYALVLAVLGIGWLIADSGFGAALIQKSQIDDHDIGYALGWVLIVAFIAGGGISLSAKWLAAMFNEPALMPVFRVTGLLVIIQALSNIPASLMRRELDAKRLQVIQLSSYIIGFGVVGIVLALNGGGVWSLVIAFLIQTLISVIAMYGCVRHTLQIHWTGDASLRHFGLRVVGTNLANWAIDNLDRMMVGKIWGMPSLGAYSVTLGLSRAPIGMLISSVQSVAFASAAKVKEDRVKLKHGYLALLGAALLVTFPLFMLLGLNSETVIAIVYGTRWKEAVPLFQAFSVSTPLFVVTAITGPLLWSMGQVGREFRIQLLVLVLMMAGFWALSWLTLAIAIWLIPVVYLLRAVLMMRILAFQIRISLLDILLTMRGGVILAFLVISIWALLSQIGASNHLISLLRMIFTASMCTAVLYFSRGRLLGRDTKALLLARKKDSEVARLLLKLAGI